MIKSSCEDFCLKKKNVGRISDTLVIYTNVQKEFLLPKSEISISSRIYCWGVTTFTMPKRWRLWSKNSQKDVDFEKKCTKWQRMVQKKQSILEREKTTHMDMGKNYIEICKTNIGVPSIFHFLLTISRQPRKLIFIIQPYLTPLDKICKKNPIEVP